MTNRWVARSRALLLGMLASVACAPTGRPAPRVVNDPCQDSAYLAMKARPVDSLSEREFQLLRDHQRLCLEVRQLTTLPAGAQHATIDPHQLIPSTKPGIGPGTSDIFIENVSNVPVIITALRLYDCTNIRTACTVSYPRARIGPGQIQRILTVHAFPDGASSFRYEYQYEVAGGH